MIGAPMDAYTAYATQAASTASPAQLVLMLYDGALARLEAARNAIEAEPQRVDDANAALTRAQRILAELRSTLDHERGGRVAANLGDLYDYCLRRLVDANVGKDVAAVSEVADLVRELRDVWSQACVTGSAAVAG